LNQRVHRENSRSNKSWWTQSLFSTLRLRSAWRFRNRCWCWSQPKKL